MMYNFFNPRRSYGDKGSHSFNSPTFYIKILANDTFFEKKNLKSYQVPPRKTQFSPLKFIPF